MEKKIIEQKSCELVLHQNVARMRGRLTPIQSKGMNSILKRAYEIVTHDPNTQEFVIPTELFLSDIQSTDTSGKDIVISRLKEKLEDLMTVKFDWGTTQNPKVSVFMSDIDIDKNEIKIHFSNYIREHIKPLNQALIVKDFLLLQSFKSEYARQLYKHLMAWDARQIAEFSLTDLKDFIGVPKTKNYERMDKLKLILNRAVKEINEKCPQMKLDYVQKKTGAKITHISFGWLTHKKQKESNLTELEKFCISLIGKHVDGNKILKVDFENNKFNVHTEIGLYVYPNIEMLKKL